MNRGGWGVAFRISLPQKPPALRLRHGRLRLRLGHGSPVIALKTAHLAFDTGHSSPPAASSRPQQPRGRLRARQPRQDTVKTRVCALILSCSDLAPCCPLKSSSAKTPRQDGVHDHQLPGRDHAFPLNDLANRRFKDHPRLSSGMPWRSSPARLKQLRQSDLTYESHDHHGAFVGP